MDERSRAMILVLLLCVTADAFAEDLDVCATCHADAICEEKLDGSGKICNCKYGFAGNGRTYCIDKDECVIGASKICGQHSTCHNTVGSYYCTCLAGYSPSNNMDVFIPNDGTLCQDIDECRVEGLCGEGGGCRNLKGSYECSCLLGYEVHDGVEPFHPDRDRASCRAVHCGQPGPVEDTLLLSVTGSTYNSVATYECDEGLVWRRGDNRSVCGADGRWRRPTMVCEDIDECRVEGLCGEGGGCRNLKGSYECSCLLGYEVHDGVEPFHPDRDRASCRAVHCGQPGPVEDTLLLSVTGSTYNSVATYECDEGLVWRRGDNRSVCGADGRWRRPTMVCEDIDECRVEGLCGEGGGCRNLKGSYECSCLLGYEVHDGVEPFHPDRDRASCRAVHCGQPGPVEDTLLLSVTGSTYNSVATYECDEGLVWRRGDNRSVCGADGRWRRPTMVCEEVDCGSPPALPHSHMLWNKSTRMGAEVLYQCNHGYHNVGKGNKAVCTAAGRWERPSLLCQETFCGSPPVIESTEQVWDNNSAPGSTVSYVCKEGFDSRGGRNVSVCNEHGQWTRPTLTCQEILCGDPPALPHTGRVWNGSSTPGSTVTYHCKTGFYSNEGENMSMCSVDGQWTKPSITCEEVDCGEPPIIPNAVMQWDHVSTVGAQVVYQCVSGCENVGGGNVSVCDASGKWDAASLICQEITCQQPVFKPHANMLWDGTSHVGSVVFYQCEEGFYTRGLRNDSVCGEDGLWQDTDLWCEEISCGPPLNIPFTNLLWDRTSSPGSVVRYECVDGFYQESGNNVSTCLLSGEWGEVFVQCKAKCGPVPFLANAEVVWHNRSVVIHSCREGFHSWRGSNVSTCGSSGLWQRATLRCIETKPPINNLCVLHERCLHWRAEKYEEDTEIYTVTFVGSRDFQRSFHHQRKKTVTSKADQLELCLDLLPLTNYSISVTARSARFTATIITNTSLPVPAAPIVYYREFETPVPTLRLRRSPDTLDSISLYQVFVIRIEGIGVFDCSSPLGSHPSNEHIAAQMDVRHVGTETNFTVGDGLYYGGFFNEPLENGRDYYIILRAVSRWKTDTKSSCVLWAKVRGLSYARMVSSLSTAAVVVLVAVGGLVGCSFFYGRCLRLT